MCPDGCASPGMVYRVLLVMCCLAGALLAQTFQYSRGWTNGRKRSGPPSPHEAACQLQKLRIILEGKNTPQVNEHFYSIYQLISSSLQSRLGKDCLKK